MSRRRKGGIKLPPFFFIDKVKTVDVSEYEGYVHKMRNFFPDPFDVYSWEEYEEVGEQITVTSPRTSGKTFRWKKHSKKYAQHEEKLFIELLAEIHSAAMDEEVLLYKQLIVNSPILRTHVDVGNEINRQLENAKKVLYERVKLLKTEKYVHILTSKINALWE